MGHLKLLPYEASTFQHLFLAFINTVMPIRIKQC